MARPQNVSWVQQWWRALVAETVSTALLVWVGCATMVAVGEHKVLLSYPALGFGFAVLANIMAFGAASGAHMNPAVTLGALLYGQLPPLAAAAYVLAQLLGATLGFAGLVAVSPAAAVAAPAGVTLPGPGVSALAAAVTEALITALLVLAVCGVWAEHDPARPDFTAPIKIGLVVAGLVFAAGPSTGASLNPARSFAPALLQGVWEHHWVYWVGPLLGGALAALLHRWVISPRARAAPADADAQIPLNDKP